MGGWGCLFGTFALLCAPQFPQHMFPWLLLCLAIAVLDNLVTTRPYQMSGMAEWLLTLSSLLLDNLVTTWQYQTSGMAEWLLGYLACSMH
jgi:hypothetical protein